MGLKHRTVVLLFLVATLTLTLLVSVNSADAQPSQEETPKATVLFTVHAQQLPNGYIVPFAIYEQGQFKPPVAGDSDGDELLGFSNSYYSKGQRYRVLFGGAEAGSLTVSKSNKDEECAKTSANVALRTQAKLNQNVMALATNSDSLGKGKSTRRAPTPAERAALMPLVRAMYRQKGVAAALLPTLTTVNLTALDLNNDGKSELIGTFIVKKHRGGAARYALFLFAEPQGSSYRTTALQYERFTGDDLMSGAEITAIDNGVYLERLVDALDFDGDGFSEVVTVRDGLEGDGYSIYKKQGEAWNRAYEFANYRCAF